MPEPKQTQDTGASGPRAFPISTDEFFDRGMQLRDFFAAAALTGLLASAESGDFARRAYTLADEMIEQRAKAVQS